MTAKDRAIAAALPDDEQVKAEYKRIMALFNDADPAQLKLALKEISRAAFLGVMLDRLERDITENGYSEEYMNGAKQFGIKKSAAADLHVSYTKNYLSVMKVLHKFLDRTGGVADQDGFEGF